MSLVENGDACGGLVHVACAGVTQAYRRTLGVSVAPQTRPVHASSRLLHAWSQITRMRLRTAQVPRL